jgi:hypothetical protein
MALSAVVCRSFSDHDPANPDAQNLWQRLQEWVHDQDLDCELESREQTMVHAPLGSLKKADCIRATWRVEGLAILAWSLRLFPLPAHDSQINPYEVTDSLAFLNRQAADIVLSAAMRSDQEINACRV